MYLKEKSRNCLGIIIALLCVLVAIFGFCLICGAVFLKLHLKQWDILFREYDPQILFICFLSVGCPLFIVHLYGAKHGHASGYVETRESYLIFFMPLMFFMVLMIIGMIITGSLCVVHRGRMADGFKDGMLSRIKMYKKDRHVKTVIDKLQMKYECCGSLSFKDWFASSWISNKFVNTDDPDVKRLMVKGQFFTDDAPFSCCQIEAMRPCIFHRVTQFDAHPAYTEITLNKDGCSESLSSYYDTYILYPALCGLFAASGIEMLLIIFLRHLQTSILSANDSGYPSMPGEAVCCKPQPAYNPKSARMEDRLGLSGMPMMDSNYSNIANSLSYNEDLELIVPKALKSDKGVRSATKTTSDKFIRTNTRKKKWLGQRNSCKNGNTKQGRIPTKNDNDGNIAEDKANNQSEKSKIRRKKWLGQRKQDTSTHKNTKSYAALEFREQTASKSVRISEDVINDQNKSTNQHGKS